MRNRFQNPIQVVLFVAISLLAVACARNYSGKYECVITTERKCYALASGKCVDLNSMEGMMNSPFIEIGRAHV